MKTFNLQNYEFEEEIENLKTKINRINSLNDVDLKDILNSLLTIVNSYYHFFVKINTSLEASLTVIELTDEKLKTLISKVNEHTELFDLSSNTIKNISDSQTRTTDILVSHGDMIDRIIDLIPKK